MALAYFRELGSKARFAIWRIEEDVDNLKNRLQLDARERSILEKLHPGKRKLQWLSTRVLLREMLKTSEFIDCPNDEHGKPYLANFPQKISLTHSYDYVSVFLSDDKEVGIDLELVKPKILRIADKFMKEEELEFIPFQDEELAIKTLYACWCAKEAVYKLQGRKGVSFRDNMTISPFEFTAQGVLHLDLLTENEQKRLEVFYEEFQEYMLAFALDNP